MYPYPERPDVPDINQVRSHLLKGGVIGRGELIKLVKDVTHIFDREQNVVNLSLPVVIVGDIHGQFFDMDHMFQKVIDKRKLPENKLLFLGDYVDRGMYSVEVLIMLFALKLNYPKSVVMLRGNHESRRMTEHYTFRTEVMEKY
jgi:serine/threonine-protein phosphatase 2B catalytic subunit